LPAARSPAPVSVQVAGAKLRRIIPLKLKVGVSRKMVLLEYGSIGAACSVALELDATLLDRDLKVFHTQVRHAYSAARQAVHDELARLQTAGAQAPTKPPARDAVNESGAGNGHARGNSEAVQAGRTAAEALRSGKPATASQLQAIRLIARQKGAELVAILRSEYDVERPEDLTLRQASALIDHLKGEG
jgi:hypothetical protein